MSDHFLIFGHRGSPRLHPENTLESFEATVRTGADGFETDLRLLADDIPVLFHDDEIGDETLETLSFRDVAQRGTPLHRVAELAPFAVRTTMILEVKRSKWEERLLREVKGWPNIIVASFDHTLVADLSRRRVEFSLGLTIYGVIVDVAAYAAGLGASWVFPNFRYVGEEMVKSLHDAGIRVVPWTPNLERHWDHLRTIGCDGVITDLPAEAVSWRNA